MWCDSWQAGVIDEMMEDMMDSAMDEPELEEETEEEVDKVGNTLHARHLWFCNALLNLRKLLLKLIGDLEGAQAEKAHVCGLHSSRQQGPYMTPWRRC